MITELLGFSQTYQWYTGQPFVFPITDPTFAPQKKFLAEYPTFANVQARFGFGGDLSRWKDPDFIGYEGHVVHNIINDRTEITRLIFNVSGESRTIDEWMADIKTVIAFLLNKYPNLKEFYLQPVIGGLDNTSPVRSVKNQPTILEAIETVVKKSSGIIKVGAVVKLESSGFNDSIGHLTMSGALKSRALIFKFYDIHP